MGRAVMRVAAIDLGTNMVRLLVADAAARGWTLVEAAQRVTRLGQGQATAGALGPGAMTRTLDTVAEFVRRAEQLGAQRVRILATSAVREAPNRDEFTAQLAGATGRTVEVISGDEEARVTLLGVRSGLPELAGRYLVLDIGGGSTELTLAGDAGLERSVSLRLGVGLRRGPSRRWAVRRRAPRRPPCRGAGTPRPRDSRRHRRRRRAAAGRHRGHGDDARRAGPSTHRIRPRPGQGHRLERVAIERLLDRLAALTNAARAELPALEAGRADLIVPGTVICLEVMRRVGLDALTVSDRGLREGILCEILAASLP